MRRPHIATLLLLATPLLLLTATARSARPARRVVPTVASTSATATLFAKVERRNTEQQVRANGRKQFDAMVAGVEFRHELMLSCLDPVLQARRGARWLTLGDVWAREAIYIHKKGGHATASSLQDGAIKAAARWGYIDAHALQNAEAMTYPDNAFDFTFIKEAFHHLARPYAGVYEMIRVARTAAILFEPANTKLATPVTGVNASIFGEMFTTDFEVCGFQYRVDAFEMVKTAMALNLPAIAFRGWNDPYTEPLEDNVEADYMERLRSVNDMGARGERLYNLLAVVFIKRMGGGLLASLERGGYTVLRLQQYVDRGQCV